MNVLLVDDDLVDRKHIQRTLKRGSADIIVVEAENVDLGLEQLKDNKFDVVLCDFNMPRKNGMDMINALKVSNSSDAKLGTPIIIISTSEDDDLAVRCLEAGAQDFLTKTDITGFRLRRAIASAKTRFKLEERLVRSHKKIQIMAEQDGLTKLANRHMFDIRLEQTLNELKRNKENKERVALILLDLDHFKDVNDNYGHDVGDELLQRVVNRIKGCLRGSEVFARLGGDEFAIILPQLESVHIADKVGGRILKVLEKPFLIKGVMVSIGASIGIAFCPDNAQNRTEIFKFADIAMYKAKALGRNQIAFFEDDMQKQFLARLEAETRLRKAVKAKSFELHYQPVFNGDDLNEIGYEALIRWVADDNPMRPDEFIPIAEETRLINELGQWIIDQAIHQLSLWNNTNKESINFKAKKMAINLSPVQLSDINLSSFIKGCLDKYKVPAEMIEFELTETALLDVSEQTITVIESISKLGCHIALDDFGTGYSSISHLHQFPIDTVKIDKSLMPTGKEKEKNYKLVRGLVAMANSLELNIVAEGVETLEQVEMCQKLNIQCLQGFFLSRPLSVSHIDDMHRALSKRKQISLDR
ncbi:MAG: GGDEF domain-containing response regulator [Gammaproteobacteria bacterium]|nr:MAG: GGDEF domain-containing response regulator [Gammaproteobacteria bacterium]